jgi:hypothetical protein
MKKPIGIFLIIVLAFVGSDILYNLFFAKNGSEILGSENPYAKSVIASKAYQIADERKVSKGIYDSEYELDKYRLNRIPELEVIAARFKGQKTDDIGKQWNQEFIHQLKTGQLPSYRKVVLSGYTDSCLTFKSYDGSMFPVYRYMANCQIPNSTAAFNDFGWSGSNINFIKPPNTIRIAFIGGSTTQKISGCDYSYSDYVEAFLNSWAKTENPDIRFETINTGRVAQRSMDFASIVKHELLPMEPDFVIYYEGRNQFSLQDLVGYNHYDSSYQPFLYKLFSRSIWLKIAARVLGFNLLRTIESTKQDVDIKLDESIDEDSPEVYNLRLPINLPQIVQDLDVMRDELDSINSQFVLCSFCMILNDTLFNNALENASIYSYWSHDYCGIPLKEIERLYNLENAVFETYAQIHKTHFIDVASDLLGTPEAFIDGIHLSCHGTKLHGWSVFSQLLPIISEQIESGQLPRPSSQTDTVHPFITPEWELMPVP